MWTISNIICNTKEDLEIILKSKILANVLKVYRLSNVLSIKIEAMYVVSSLLQNLEKNVVDEVLKLYEIECVLVDILKESSDANLVILALSSLYSIFSKTKEIEEV